MSEPRRIYVIENEASVEPLLQGGGYRAGRDVVVCVHYLPYLRLRRAEGTHQYCFSEELLAAADYARLHRAADTAASGWYRREGEDVTRFQGLSYGQLVEITFNRRYLTPNRMSIVN